MTENKASDVADLEDQDQLQRPRWLMPALLLWIGLVIAGVLALPHAWGTVEPAPAPSPTPDECTAEYVETNGICLTWDDYHGGQPTYTQAP